METNVDNSLVENLFGDFELSQQNINKCANLDNEYMQELMDSSGLFILQEAKVKKAYEVNKEIDLFHLYFTWQYINLLYQWTNAQLIERYNVRITDNKMLAYIGLEMGMSLIGYNNIPKYLKDNAFSGHKECSNTMSCTDFQNIHANITFCPTQESNQEAVVVEPLWHSRNILCMFQKHCASIAVQIGTAAIDKNTVCTKVWTTIKTYMPSKPVPYGIWFYAVCGTLPGAYLHSFTNNCSGNTLTINPVQEYCNNYHNLLKRIYQKNL